MALNLSLSVSAKAHAQLLHTQTCTHHMEEIAGTLVYIYKEIVLRKISNRVDERDLSLMV